VVTDLASHQLRNGARGIAYRAQQLTNVAILQNRVGVARILNLESLSNEGHRRIVVTTLSNALIESALANARTLAFFLHERRREADLHYSHFIPEWADDVSTVTGRAIGTISEYLSHSQVGSRDPLEHVHPGEWPVGELALVLVSGVNRLVSALGSDQQAWFEHMPSTYEGLMSADFRSVATQLSQNPKVRQMTEDLQSYLSDHTNL